MTRTESVMYDLSDVLDLDEVASIRPGSSILVSGPAMTGKEDLALEIRADGVRHGEGAVAVTTGTDAEQTIADLESRVPESAFDGSRVAAIDCRGNNSREDVELDNGALVYRIPSPSNLTGIGISITKCFDRFHDIGVDRSRLALVSLSTMIT